MDGIRKYSKEWFALNGINADQLSTIQELKKGYDASGKYSTSISNSIFIGSIDDVNERLDSLKNTHGSPSMDYINIQKYGAENIFSVLDADGNGEVTEQEVLDVAALSTSDNADKEDQYLSTKDLQILYDNALAAIDSSFEEEGNQTTITYADGKQSVLEANEDDELIQKTEISNNEDGSKYERTVNYEDNSVIESRYDSRGRLTYKNEDYEGELNDITTTIQYGNINIGREKTNSSGSTAAVSSTSDDSVVIDGKVYSLKQSGSTAGNITTTETVGKTSVSVQTNGGYVFAEDLELKYDSDQKIGDTEQESIGDCWVLAGVNALNDSAIGRQIIKDSIQQNDDGSVTVTLNGIGKTYTYTPEDVALHEYNTSSKKYSSGDIDMNLIEMAIADYREDLIASGDYGKNSRDLSATAGNEATVDDPLKGGQIDEAIYYLTGYTSEYSSWDSEKTQEFIEKYEDSVNKYVMTVSFREKDPSIEEGTITTFHAYSVTKVDDDYVYVVNPWDSSVEIPYPREDFYNNAKQIALVDLMPGQNEHVITAPKEGAIYTPIEEDNVIDNFKQFFKNLFS